MRRFCVWFLAAFLFSLGITFVQAEITVANSREKPFVVFDSIAYLKKPDLSKIGMPLLPLLEGYPVCLKNAGQDVPEECKESYITADQQQTMKRWPWVFPWAGFWNQKPSPKYTGAPNIDRIDQSAKLLFDASKTLYYLDLEAGQLDALRTEWPKCIHADTECMDSTSDFDAQIQIFKADWKSQNASHWDTAILYMRTIADRIHSISPFARLGYYGEMPMGSYWSIVNRARELLICEKPGKQCSREHLSKSQRKAVIQYELWKARNEYFGKLASSVDVLFPTLYTNYREKCAGDPTLRYPPLASYSDRCPGPWKDPDPEITDESGNIPEKNQVWNVSRNAWKAYAAGTLQEGRRYGKPMYVFLWPQYHDNGVCQQFETQEIKLTSATTISEYQTFPISVQKSILKAIGSNDEEHVVRFFQDNCQNPGRAGRMAIPGEYWRFQLETVYELADGIVIWDYASEAAGDWNSLTACNDPSKWLYQTIDFLIKKGLSPFSSVSDACHAIEE